MYCKVKSAVLKGLGTEFVWVETDIQNGLPMIHMVGCLAAEVKESAERIKAAAIHIGIKIPSKKIVVNLAPAWVRKRGAALDLPIAVSILGALLRIPENRFEKVLVLGELGLDGSVRTMKGLLPMLLQAKEEGITTCIIPYENLFEGTLADGIRLVGVKSLKETMDFFENGKDPGYSVSQRQKKDGEKKTDFSDMKGQKVLKRAAEVAACGGHNLLMIGPPGSGKTMLAKRMIGILPEMTEEEQIEMMKVYSVVGMVESLRLDGMQRPFREVHHTVTKAALIGGGTIPKPGELSLANGGILFLDELAEFQRGVLETLREPLEERKIRLIRNSGIYLFPADCMIVAATNACPCGNFPDLNTCTCTPAQRKAYFGRISQPILSRMDLCVETSKIKFMDMEKNGKEETTASIKKRVERVRKIQEERFGRKGMVNAKMEIGDIEEFCQMNKEAKECMREAYERLDLTPRTYHKTLKVARTIADLAEETVIGKRQIREALGYRIIQQKNFE